MHYSVLRFFFFFGFCFVLLLNLFLYLNLKHSFLQDRWRISSPLTPNFHFIALQLWVLNSNQINCSLTRLSIKDLSCTALAWRRHMPLGTAFSLCHSIPFLTTHINNSLMIWKYSLGSLQAMSHKINIGFIIANLYIAFVFVFLVHLFVPWTSGQIQITWHTFQLQP